MIACYCSAGRRGHIWTKEGLCPSSPVPPPVEERERGADFPQRGVAAQMEDTAVLADLFKRAMKAGIIEARSHFRPSWHITLIPGAEPGIVELTDDEIEVIRRTV